MEDDEWWKEDDNLRYQRVLDEEECKTNRKTLMKMIKKKKDFQQAITYAKNLQDLYDKNPIIFKHDDDTIYNGCLKDEIAQEWLMIGFQNNISLYEEKVALHTIGDGTCQVECI